MTIKLAYEKELTREIKQTPAEYLPALLQIVRLYRESVTLNPAAESFRQGWSEVLRGETLPLTELWDNIYVANQSAKRSN